MTQTYKETIRAFLSQHIRDNSFQDDDDLFGKGYLNSLFAMEMVLFVEKEFALTIENTDLDPDNFRSVNALAAFVEQKTGAGEVA
jgi:acyl carrier protein